MSRRKDTRGGAPDLGRIAADLDHIRALGTLGVGRRDSLRRAAAIVRANARNGPNLTPVPLYPLTAVPNDPKTIAGPQEGNDDDPTRRPR